MDVKAYALAVAEAAVALDREQRWIPATERVPERGKYLCRIQPRSGKAYTNIAYYGPYEYVVDDDKPTLAPGEVFSEDEGMVSGLGWHREEDSHGGEYDTYVLTFHDSTSRGQVTHWQPQPPPPEIETRELRAAKEKV